MDDDRRLQITLELDMHGEEVRGRAVPEGGDPRDFVGWMGLLAVLDDLLAPAEAAD
jgi:hypothetical protein